MEQTKEALKSTTNQSNGASFPPINPGPSWNVPRVSLPGIMGMLFEYYQEWWYYVGTLYDSNGNPFSLQITIVRSGESIEQFGVGMVGIGWPDGNGKYKYLFSGAFGLGASDSELIPASLTVPPVSDDSYNVNFVPEIEIIAMGPNPEEDLKIKVAEGSEWNIAYTDGGILASVGSNYNISMKGSGYTIGSDSTTTEEATFSLSLSLEDMRGMVMENVSGYVGPEAGQTTDAPSSYECAQPWLNINSGSFTINGEDHVIGNGSRLWFDRQMLAHPKKSDKAPAAPTNSAELIDLVKQGAIKASGPLYVGNWMGVTLDNGLSLVLVEFWNQSQPQWITGNMVGKPPKSGFGNVYYKLEDGIMANGGMMLRPRIDMSQPDNEWDYDVNILDPQDPDSSPHWTSPLTGVTYATAWRIDFSPNLNVDGLPETMYIFAVCDNCEIVPPTLEDPFFEGGARIYTDTDQTHFIGQAFMEQMGFQ